MMHDNDPTILPLLLLSLFFCTQMNTTFSLSLTHTLFQCIFIGDKNEIFGLKYIRFLKAEPVLASSLTNLCFLFIWHTKLSKRMNPHCPAGIFSTQNNNKRRKKEKLVENESYKPLTLTYALHITHVCARSQSHV